MRATLIVVCGCLLISCGTRNATIPASDLSVDGSSPSPAPGPGPACPKSAPKAGGACPSAKMECTYVRVYCPDNPMGPEYFYERDIYRCKGGAWVYEGQDCYDCCRWSADGGLSHACPAAAKKGGACAVDPTLECTGAGDLATCTGSSAGMEKCRCVNNLWDCPNPFCASWCPAKLAQAQGAPCAGSGACYYDNVLCTCQGGTISCSGGIPLDAGVDF